MARNKLRWMLVAKVSLLLFVAAFLAGCTTQAAGGPSTAKPRPTVRAQKDPKIWLNDVQFGTAANLSALRAKLKAISAERQKNPIYREQKANANLEDLAPPQMIAADVYLHVGPGVSVRDVFSVYKAVSDADGDVFLLRGDLRKPTDPVKPDPNILIISIGEKFNDPGAYGIPAADDDGLYSSQLLLIESRNSSDVLVARSFGGGIEIADDGGYLLYQKYENVDANRPLYDFPPRQKPLARSDLAKEIDLELPAADTKVRNLLFIASSNAPFQSVTDLRAAAGDRRLRLQADIYGLAKK